MSIKLIVGKVYEVQYRILFGEQSDRDFMRLVGFSSRNRPIFESRTGYYEADDKYNIILPLSEGDSSVTEQEIAEAVYDACKGVIALVPAPASPVDPWTHIAKAVMRLFKNPS